MTPRTGIKCTRTDSVGDAQARKTRQVPILAIKAFRYHVAIWWLHWEADNVVQRHGNLRWGGNQGTAITTTLSSLLQHVELRYKKQTSGPRWDIRRASIEISIKQIYANKTGKALYCRHKIVLTGCKQNRNSDSTHLLSSDSLRGFREMGAGVGPASFPRITWLYVLSANTTIIDGSPIQVKQDWAKMRSSGQTYLSPLYVPSRRWCLTHIVMMNPFFE